MFWTWLIVFESGRLSRPDFVVNVHAGGSVTNAKKPVKGF